MLRTTTVSNLITIEGEVSTYGDFLSTHSMYGERESGFSLPNSVLGSNLDRANAQSRRIQAPRKMRRYLELLRSKGLIDEELFETVIIMAKSRDRFNR